MILKGAEDKRKANPLPESQAGTLNSCWQHLGINRCILALHPMAPSFQLYVHDSFLEDSLLRFLVGPSQVRFGEMNTGLIVKSTWISLIWDTYGSCLR